MLSGQRRDLLAEAIQATSEVPDELAMRCARHGEHTISQIGRDLISEDE